MIEEEASGGQRRRHLVVAGAALALPTAFITASAEPPAKFRAVLVASTKYLGGLTPQPTLVAALPRVEDALRTFARRGGYGSSDIEFNRHTDSGTLAAALPARDSDIVKSVSAAARVSRPGDTLVVYFTGHGTTAPDGRMYLHTSGADDLVPADRIDVRDQLVRLIQRLSSATVNLLMIDACRSPSGGDALGSGGPLVGSAAAFESLKAQGIATMFAARQGEHAWVNSQTGFGYFTEELIAGLVRPDVRTAEELTSQVGASVARRVQLAFPGQQRTQNPILSVEQSPGGGYSLLPRPSPSPAPDPVPRPPSVDRVDRCRPGALTILSTISVSQELLLDIARNAHLPPGCSLVAVSAGSGQRGNVAVSGGEATYEPNLIGEESIPLTLTLRAGAATEVWRLQWTIRVVQARQVDPPIRQ